MNGVVVGCWDGMVKLFAALSKDPISTWSDPDYPDEPVRGLIVGTEGMILSCNDFQLNAVSSDLSSRVKVFKAKETDTCNIE